MHASACYFTQRIAILGDTYKAWMRSREIDEEKDRNGDKEKVDRGQMGERENKRRGVVAAASGQTAPLLPAHSNLPHTLERCCHE